MCFLKVEILLLILFLVKFEKKSLRSDHIYSVWFCFQYMLCSVSAQGIEFSKATHCPASDTMSDTAVVRSRFSCASQCSIQPECFAFKFSGRTRICNMYMSYDRHNISTDRPSCTYETALYCRGMCRVWFVKNSRLTVTESTKSFDFHSMCLRSLRIELSEFFFTSSQLCDACWQE